MIITFLNFIFVLETEQTLIKYQVQCLLKYRTQLWVSSIQSGKSRENYPKFLKYNLGSFIFFPRTAQ